MNKASHLVALFCAATMHSVHRTSRAFLDDGPAPAMPNVEHYERDRFVCFVEGDGGGDGGAGGAGGDVTPKFDDVQQKHVNGLLAKEKRAFQAKLDEATKAQAARDAEFAELKSKLEALELEKSEHGKTTAEKEKLAAERERAAWAKKLAENDSAKAASEKAAADARNELREERISNRVATSFSKLKLAQGAAEDALGAFRRSAKIELADDGSIASVEVDGEPFSTLDEATAAWLKKKPHFEAAPSGGAGSRASNGGGSSKPAYLRSTEENLAAANERRASRGR